MNPVPDPVLLRKSGSAGNQTRDLWICSQELWPLDHRRIYRILKSNMILKNARRVLEYKRTENVSNWNEEAIKIFRGMEL
jgi:hypothetical protein